MQANYYVGLRMTHDGKCCTGKSPSRRFCSDAAKPRGANSTNTKLLSPISEQTLRQNTVMVGHVAEEKHTLIERKGNT